MKQRYEKPLMHSEEFMPNQFIAGCALNIVSGTDTVKVYCAKQSYITVFTAESSCTYQREPFTSNSDAETFFGSLFQWGDGIAEGKNVNNNTTTNGWTTQQRTKAEQEINNGWSTLPGTIKVGEQDGRVHAGYCLDYLNGFAEGKALS